LIWKLEAALFLDAGNIWTIRDYAEQPTGVFRWNEFYKQIACNYGAGLRLDFDFFVIRVDMGIKLYDPGYPIKNERWRTELSWKNDFALHFAVGYPF
jgi:outer membrane protein assembly factor BamA